MKFTFKLKFVKNKSIPLHFEVKFFIHPQYFWIFILRITRAGMKPLLTCRFLTKTKKASGIIRMLFK